MQRDYHEGRLKLLGMEEYVNIICDQLEIIPKISLFIVLQVTLRAICSLVQCGVFKKWEVLNALIKKWNAVVLIKGVS